MVTGAGDVLDQQRAKSLTMEDLYGEGKPYPEPYNAGTDSPAASQSPLLLY